ncbi:MAG: FlgD immunoglobulin-like domain containing protein, partial [Ignavibacteria bacterium]|nr:FlgD immunoglobulin-like domain containing protein [Ignavibacteria bacterium]
DNGRGVDDRGNDIDTLIYENNTFYNLTSRILRDGGGIIKYCWINHNTVVNVAQWGCSPGPVIEGHFRNNLFINTGFIGRSATQTWFMFDTAPLAQSYIDQGITQTLKIHNNNFYVSPEITSALPSDRTPTPVLNPHAQAAVDAGGWGATITNLAVAFNKGPQVPLNVMQDYFNSAVTVKTDMDKGGASPDFGQTQMTFNFSYPTSSSLYTSGTGAQPLGDLNYFGIPVGVSNDEILANNFNLYSNYPNPFNPSTNIRYSIPTAGNVTIEIYNSLGQLVNTIVNQYQESGTHNVVWNGTDMSGQKLSSGIYIYKLNTNNYVSSKKMVLIK